MSKNFIVKCKSCNKIILQYRGIFGSLKSSYSVCDDCKQKFPELTNKIEDRKNKKKIEKQNKEKVEMIGIKSIEKIQKEVEKEMDKNEKPDKKLLK